MARPSFRWMRRRFGVNSLYLVAAVVVFAVVVFLLFRDRSSGPQTVAAGGGASETDRVGEVAESGTPQPPDTRPQPQPDQTQPASPPAQAQGAIAAHSALTVPAAGDNANQQVTDILAQVSTLMQSEPGRVINARDRLNEALRMPMSAEQRKAVKERLSKLADDWLFGPAPFPGDTLCEAYTVQSGDVLQVIGNRHKVPYGLLMQINNISRPENLRAGRTIKVVHGPFNAKVYRSSFALDLYLQDTYVGSFQVGLGKPGFETPTGMWRVQEGGKLIKPTWTDPDTGRTYTASDPDYPLGSRWIALDGIDGEARGRTGFAIHGTKDPDQIGTAGSRGCIRMYNGDAVLMYKALFPVYSKIEVLP